MYSDADIVLSSDWVPPLTIAPAAISTDTVSMASCEGRKKTSSVSFSVDENENQPAVAEKVTGEVKKSKVSATTSSNFRNYSFLHFQMLKRLSYPLSWVEGFTGETGKSADSDSAPTTSDSNQSVFSKVFSR